MSMLVDEHTSLLDPTCGSASALRAAESLGAQTVLGMDSDEQTVGLARMALRQARTMRGLSVVEGLTNMPPEVGRPTGARPVPLPAFASWSGPRRPKTW